MYSEYQVSNEICRAKTDNTSKVDKHILLMMQLEGSAKKFLWIVLKVPYNIHFHYLAGKTDVLFNLTRLENKNKEALKRVEPAPGRGCH